MTFVFPASSQSFFNCFIFILSLNLKLGEIITQYLYMNDGDLAQRIELRKPNVIFNIPHPSLLLHIHDKTTGITFLLLTQEIKRGIVYERMNQPTSA